jgi:hypothetical protein
MAGTVSPNVTPLDHSGTITSGGTAQTLMNANAYRTGYYIQNTSSADLWVDDKGGTAVQSQPSIKIPSGSLYENPPNGVTGTAISIIGGTTGQAFTAREW